MTKRAAGKYPRMARDFYATPEEPILKLIPHLGDTETFAEPMCGDGAIVSVLENRGWEAVFLCDLEPQGDMIDRAEVGDVLDTDASHYVGADLIVSNPPWPLPPNKLVGMEAGSPTVHIIRHLMAIKPTWLLLAADFMQNRYFESLHPFCTKVVAVGRVSWQGNGKKGFDNAAWYRFDATNRRPSDWFIPNREADEHAYHPSVEDLL